jgi:hypothetical protein
VTADSQNVIELMRGSSDSSFRILGPLSSLSPSVERFPLRIGAVAIHASTAFSVTDGTIVWPHSEAGNGKDQAGATHKDEDLSVMAMATDCGRRGRSTLG